MAMDTEYCIFAMSELGLLTSLELHLCTNSPVYHTLRNLTDTNQTFGETLIENEVQRYLDDTPNEGIYSHICYSEAHNKLSYAYMKARVLYSLRKDIGDSLNKDNAKDYIEAHYLPLIRRTERDARLTFAAKDWKDLGNIPDTNIIGRHIEASMHDMLETSLRRIRDLPTAYFDTDNPVRAPTKIREPKLGLIKSTRRSINKSLNLLRKINYESQIRIMAKGVGITIDEEKSKYKYLLKPKVGWIKTWTEQSSYMSPYGIDLYTKDDIFVASLCVYITNTPVLDQLIALIMFIKSGEEEYFLEKANWFNIKDYIILRKNLKKTYPTLLAKFPVRKSETFLGMIPEYQDIPDRLSDEFEIRMHEIIEPLIDSYFSSYVAMTQLNLR